MTRRRLLPLVLFFVALVAVGQPGLDARLSSDDEAVSRAAVNEVLENPQRVEPLMLILTAAKLFERGDKDSAVFWFYAGQLRARYAPPLPGEKKNVVETFTMTVGQTINAYATHDIPRLGIAIDQALDWDDKTLRAWAAAYRVDLQKDDLASRRARARDGLVAFKGELLKNRERYENQAR